MKRTMQLLLAMSTLVAFTPALAQERVFRIEQAAPGEIDPAKATDFSGLILASNIYDTLLWPAAGGGVEPRAAESWSISDDKKSYSFKLRHGLKFHDGSPVTADDVVFSFNRFIKLGAGYSYLFAGVVNSVKADAPDSVTFTLNHPHAPFLASLARLSIVSKAIINAHKADGSYGEWGDYGQAYLDQHDAGSGAYTVAAHDKQTLTVMKKFDGYYLPFPTNAPSEVRMSYSVEDATLRALMSRGQLDVSSMWHPNEVIADLAKQSGISAGAETVYGEGLIKFNTKRPPMDNVHMRRAVAAAIDYDAIQSILKVTDKIHSGIPSRGPIPDGLPGSDPNGPVPKRDLTAAKKELALAGYDAAAAPIEILSALCCALHQKIALLVSSNLAEVGVKTQIKEMPWALVVESASKVESTPHITFVIQNLAAPDVNSFLTETYNSSSAGRWSSMEWLENKDVDKLISEARAELDPSKRAGVYSQINKTILDLQPDAWALQPVNVFAKRNNIKLPFEDPKKATGLVAADFEFRLVQVE